MIVRLLLIEDNLGDTELIKYYIDDMVGVNVELTSVRRLEDALRSIEDNQYDLIFSDLSLPDSSGELTVKKLLQKADDIPIVVLTGNDSYELGIRLLNDGVHDFIVKEDLNTRILFKTMHYVIEKNKMLKTIEELAYKDSLTGLYNRTGFLREFEKQIINAESSNQRIALMYFDLDSFKHINDIMGHSFGDEVLTIFSKRIKNKMSSDYTFSRIGGDEFIILVPTFDEYCIIDKIINELFSVFSNPMIVDQQVINISMSVGVSLYPEHADNSEDLIKYADIAMYKAKETIGCKHEVYTVSMADGLEKKFMLNNEIKNALVKNEFSIVYQPIIDLNGDKTNIVEALLRWNNSKYGIISPSIFIPLAELNNDIISIGQWVIRNACSDIKEFNDNGYSDLCISINISPIQIKQDNFVNDILEAISDSSIDINKVTLEITENISLIEDKQTMLKLNRLREEGVSIAVDDFGTGYASISKLNCSAISKVKIDKSFIQSETLMHSSLVIDIIKMAQNLNLDVIAEGVESIEQLEFLKGHGCNLIQGFLFSRPLSKKSLYSYLDNHECVVISG